MHTFSANLSATGEVSPADNNMTLEEDAEGMSSAPELEIIKYYGEGVVLTVISIIGIIGNVAVALS